MGDIKRLSYCVLLLLFLIGFSHFNSYSATVIGEYSGSGTDETSPVITGVKETFKRDVLISVKGARINALKGSEITPYDGNGDGLLLRVDKGKIYFRVFPEVNVYTFATPLASIKTPRIVRSSDSAVEGAITVAEDGKTTLQVNSGELEVLTSKGVKKVGTGEAVTIARAGNEGEEDRDYDSGAVVGKSAGGNGQGMVPVIIGTAAVAGGTTTAVILANDDDSDGSDSTICPVFSETNAASPICP